MARIKVIVNPLAGKGYAERISPLIRQHLTNLGADFDLVRTARAGEAITLASQAVDDGFDTVVAVGGDGTSHEVVNGLMLRAHGKVAGTLGCIPAGSGNDFAVMNGAPQDVEAACRVIVEGATRLVDVGQVTIDGRITRFFDNVVGIGFDGLVTMECRKAKRLRGMALYLPVVLKTIFFSMHPPRAEIIYDGETLRQTTLMTCIANGPREGGGFLVAPNARCDDGVFDLLIAETMPKLSMLAMVPRFLKGTHLGHPLVTLKHSKHVVVRSEDPLYAHVDGEILCDQAHHIEARLIPACLRMICPRHGL
jgi:YegS/Rv2252/BmrU family lipid kinase